MKKEFLLLPAGFMWMGVGIMLTMMAARWLYHSPHPVPFAISGMIAGLFIAFFGFSRVARKNISRINALPGKRCFFSFMTLKSYFLVIFMMALGITLRHSHMPREWLSIIYTGIGLGLALSSILYFLSFKTIIRPYDQDCLRD